MGHEGKTLEPPYSILHKVPLSGTSIFPFFPQEAIEVVACLYLTQQVPRARAPPQPHPELQLPTGAKLVSSLQPVLLAWEEKTTQTQNPSPASWNQILSHLPLFKETNSLHHNLLASPELLACW